MRIAHGIRDAPPSKFEQSLRAAEEVTDLISLSIGEPDFSTPTHISEAGIQAIQEGYTHYTNNYGLLDLRKAIASKMKTVNHVDVDHTGVLVTAGASLAIDMAMRLFLEPGDEVIIQDPGYFNYIYESYFIGAKIIPVKLHEETSFSLRAIDVEDLISPHTKLLVLNSPQNPTGSVIPETELRKIADVCLEHDIYVISDEIYEYLIYGEKHFSIASIPEMLDISIILNGFSKAYAMTGWRIGYAVGNPAFIQKMGTMQMYINICAPSISQRAALAALNGPQDCVTNMVKEYERRRSYLLTRLRKMDIPCVTPGGAFYAFPNISCLGSSDDVWRLFIDKAHVSTTPGNMFGAQGEGYLRLSYANSLSNIEQALDRIETVVRRKT